MKAQSNYRDFVIITIIVILALLTVLLVTSYAQAQTAPTYRSEYAPIELHHVEHRPRHGRGHWADDDNPAYRRYVRHERHRHTRKVWRQHDYGHGYGHDSGRCKATVAVVGDQYASEQGAKDEAWKAWMQTARYMHGERFMDRTHADDAEYECGRSSVGSVVGQIFIRCRLTARPCRPETQGASK